MRYSCSSRLDWEYGTRRAFNFLSFVIFVLLGVLALFLATFTWMAATGNPFTQSLYWAVQTATTVGYGTGFSDWGTKEFRLCIAWMSISVVYWACLLAVISARIAEFFEP